MIVVADAGPIIHLSLVNKANLFALLYRWVLVPTEVYEEVVVAGAGLPGSLELAQATWSEIVAEPVEEDVVPGLKAQLGAGEAAAIFHAITRRADLILSDDRQARKAARNLSFRVKGTLGILLEAKRRGHVVEVAPSLVELRSRGTWISDELMARVLLEAGEREPG
ncbi:MAG TPA: DUF3368 domain-containing protein [Thermoanaerobaculia bacterium]|nr:DUF3368 domain-containing protein [Thermoanaerobaculia bacterium]